MIFDKVQDVPDEYALRLISQGMAEPFAGEPEPERDAAVTETPSPEREKPADAAAKEKAKPEKDSSRRDVRADEPENEG